MTKWTLLDYGAGNLHSLRRALERAGARPAITDDAADLLDADVAVLPGVGAFGPVMQSLARVRGGLRERHRAGRPTLAVCIGQQVLHEGSDEAPTVAGLGILPGQVVRLPPRDGKVPHMGWNTLEVVRDDPALAGIATGSHVYYVHSFAAVPGPDCLAATDYGLRFAALVRQGNTVGTQFHPEKSGAVGARILRNLVADLEAAA
ncbi:MAG TPA: imidazole glycerol phosphate synthase subunit HisH [Candidatus Thermoplasmatota archaeon]|nr:imidazole glycerol phosphate synthase subunit HisH [Candidatus Thermoplasmatota archaeon]